MKQPSHKATAPTGFPEFAVKRETICQFAHPPLPESTFHDFVNKGMIVPLKGVRGYYKLNDSLRRLGLREVPSIPKDASKRSQEDILRLAFSLIDPELFPMPSWFTMSDDELDDREGDHAKLLAGMYRPHMEALGCYQEKLHFAAGVIDAYADMARLRNGQA